MSICKYRAGKAMPSFEFFEKLVTRYPAVNLNWLIGKDGEMFIDPSIRPKSHRTHPPDLLEAKNEIINLQNKNIKMMEEKLKELSEELREYRAAGRLLKEPGTRRSGESKNRGER